MRSAVESFVLKSPRGASCYGFGNRVGVGSVDIDPWPAQRVEDLGQCSNACRAMNAATRVPLNLDCLARIFPSQPGENAVWLSRVRRSSGTTLSRIRLLDSIVVRCHHGRISVEGQSGQSLLTLL